MTTPGLFTTGTEAPNPAIVEAQAEEQPLPDSQGSFDVKFKHPDYPEPHNCFLSLPKTDFQISQGSGEITFGVHHYTARIACGILAGNHFYRGYFSLDRKAAYNTSLGPEDLLTEDEYYFIIPGCTFYPMVASFQDWIFPHDCLAYIWPEITINGAIDRQFCSITGCEAVEAHLVPLGEAQWYSINGMDNNRSTISGEANVFPLREDLEKCFNDGCFAIVPKLTPMGIQYVMNFLSTSAEETWPKYHGSVALQLPEDSRPNLFVRFAWAIFTRANPWIGVGEQRTVFRVYQHPATKRLCYRRHRVKATRENLQENGESKQMHERSH